MYVDDRIPSSRRDPVIGWKIYAVADQTPHRIAVEGMMGYARRQFRHRARDPHVIRVNLLWIWLLHLRRLRKKRHAEAKEQKENE